jgi:quinol monooxygenase YgiN
MALMNGNPLPFESSPIEWTVYADSAEVQKGSFNLREVWRDRKKIAAHLQAFSAG